MKTNNNIPAYRFEGYTDAWELRKLGEVSSHRGGTAIEKHFSEDGKYKVISIGSYGLDNKYLDQNIRAVENEVTRSRVVNKNELTMVLNDKTANGNIIGRCLLIETDDEFVINQRTEIISFNNEVNPKFAYVVLNGVFREQVKKIVQGGTQIYVNYSSVEQLSFSHPTLPEQSAIGSFFSTLDQQITLHQRKLDTFKEQKKTYLKLLFPAKGQTKPALRFQGFEDDWEEVKLGDIVVWEKGLGLSKSDLNIEARGGKVIHYADLYRYKEVITEIFHSSESVGGKEIPLNSLLFPMSDVTPQGLARTSSISIEGVRAGGDILIANIKDNSSIFLSYQVNANYRYILPLVTGTTVRHISSTSLSTIPISLPSLPEQEAIGTFFQTLDREITQVEDKLASLKEMKKTLLRKLFV